VVLLTGPFQKKIEDYFNLASMETTQPLGMSEREKRKMRK
jgi:hypothetical protein